METGELEIKKAFEDVIRNNVKIISDYSTSTRELVRKLSDEDWIDDEEDILAKIEFGDDFVIITTDNHQFKWDLRIEKI